MRSYARNVKEMYWPKVSEEKLKEMEQLKDPALRHSVLKLKASLLMHHQQQQEQRNGGGYLPLITTRETGADD